MQNITIYTKPTCPYCHRAKQLLEQKNTSYQELDITKDPSLRSQMIEQSGGRTTVPQIFIDGQHIGGCDDLYALEEKGGLDPLLKKAS
jgi:glutaredoxin 3